MTRFTPFNYKEMSAKFKELEWISRVAQSILFSYWEYINY